jgi:PAS domain-containing protein
VKDARDRCYVLINRTAEAIFGIARGDLIGKRTPDRSDGETATELFPLAGEALRTGELQTIDEHVVHTHHNGTRILTTRNSFNTRRDRRTTLSAQPFRGHYRAQEGGGPHRAYGAL